MTGSRESDTGDSFASDCSNPEFVSRSRLGPTEPPLFQVETAGRPIATFPVERSSR